MIRNFSHLPHFLFSPNWPKHHFELDVDVRNSKVYRLLLFIIEVFIWNRDVRELMKSSEKQRKFTRFNFSILLCMLQINYFPSISRNLLLLSLQTTNRVHNAFWNFRSRIADNSWEFMPISVGVNIWTWTDTNIRWFDLIWWRVEWDIWRRRLC